MELAGAPCLLLSNHLLGAMPEDQPSFTPDHCTCHEMFSHAKQLHHDSGTALFKHTAKVTEIPTAASDILQEAQEQLGIYKTGDLDLKVRVSVTRFHMLQWMV